MVSPAAPTATQIKLLDLLTNRYHTGLVRRSSQTSLVVELPAAARFRTGQRVRYILATDSAPVLARTAMRRASVGKVHGIDQLELHDDAPVAELV